MEEIVKKQIEELKYYLNTEYKSEQAKTMTFTYDEVLEQKIKLLENILGDWEYVKNKR